MIFFLVDLFFVIALAFLSFYQLKKQFGVIVGLGPSRMLGNFSPPVDVMILLVYWVMIFYLFGHYSRNINQSVFTIIKSTLREVIIGNLFFFLVVFGPLKLFEYENSWITFLRISAQFIVIIGIPRIITFLIINKMFEWNRIKFNFVIVGEREAVRHFLQDFNHSGYLKKYRLTGIMYLNNDEEITNEDGHPVISSYEELGVQASKGDIDEMIFVEPERDFNDLRDVITFSKKYNIQLNIPGQLTDILKGQVRISEIETPPFVVIHSKGMPLVQAVVKRVLDVFLSITGLIITVPFLPFIIYSVKKSSPGPVIFVQERIGKNGVPFRMYKFRTMVKDAEKGVPSLSSVNDPRVTSSGRWLRRWRLDEIPQLVNVLAGQMSLVGPRPERQYFMERILERAPYYSIVLKVKPGITSLGMVKFGYAENVDQMVQRLRYDVLYVENQSLILDLKILFYTIGTLLKGEGK
jgi:exopolysaccharide biosynthesis polyprenyl glycosylphosphotransferase